MPRPPRPDDLFRLRIPTEPQLSPDGRWVALTVGTVAPGFDFADFTFMHNGELVSKLMKLDSSLTTLL